MPANRAARSGARHPYRREQILRAAAKLFRLHGAGNTSMDAIARTVGIRIASIYHHFRDRGALVDAAVDRAHADLLSCLERARAEGAPRAQFGALVGELIDHVVGDVALATVGRHDRYHASAAVQRRAERADALVLAPLISVIGKVRPDLVEGEVQARARCVVGVIWSVTRFEHRLEVNALRHHLRRAAKAAAFGRPAN